MSVLLILLSNVRPPRPPSRPPSRKRSRVDIASVAAEGDSPQGDGGGGGGGGGCGGGGGGERVRVGARADPLQLDDVLRRCRPRVEDRLVMSICCALCGRRFRCEGDRKRHRCATSRPKH